MNDFISSIINPAIEEASSSHLQGLDLDTVKKIKGNLGYAKAVTEWIDEMYRVGVSYITKFRVLYVNIWNKRKELLVELQQVKKEHMSIFVLSKEVTELMSLRHTTLMIEKLVENPKEVDITWHEDLEWKERIYRSYINDIDDSLKRYLNDMMKIKNNLCALDVDLMDSFEENVWELGEMMGPFKDNY